MNQILLKIIRQQKQEWEKKQKKISSFVPRFALKKAAAALSSPLVKVILGPRRAGKSVLAAQLLAGKKAACFNFDTVALKQEAILDLRPALAHVYGEYDYLFLDEIQNLAGWELFLNQLQREGQNTVISGSNANLLSGELATHLTGRYIAIETLPFSFAEYLTAKGLDARNDPDAHVDGYLFAGGYPEVCTGQVPDGPEYLRDLVTTVIGKDVVTRHRLRKGRELESLAQWALSNVASELSYLRLSSTDPIAGLPASPKTAEKFLGYLADAYLIKVVNRFDARHLVRLASPKKLYAVDTGMANAFGFRTSPNLGRSLENTVFDELRKAGAGDDILYFRSNAGNKEVDFVIRSGNRTVELVQSCWDLGDERTRRREIAGLLAAAASCQCDRLTIVVRHGGAEVIAGPVPIRVVPFAQWATSLNAEGR